MVFCGRQLGKKLTSFSVFVCVFLKGCQVAKTLKSKCVLFFKVFSEGLPGEQD
jgi:hypothetical protein